MDDPEQPEWFNKIMRAKSPHCSATFECPGCGQVRDASEQAENPLWPGICITCACKLAVPLNKKVSDAPDSAAPNRRQSNE